MGGASGLAATGSGERSSSGANFSGATSDTAANGCERSTLTLGVATAGSSGGPACPSAPPPAA